VCLCLAWVRMCVRARAHVYLNTCVTAWMISTHNVPYDDDTDVYA